jgi:nucleotide-binding universal stress UspA family protein
MYSSILVQLNIDASPLPLLGFAKDLAHRFRANLIALCAAEARVFVSAVPDIGSASIELIQRDTADIKSRLTEVSGIFSEFANGDQSMSWRGLVGNPTRVAIEHARAGDLIVTCDPESGNSDPYRTVDTGNLILSAGRPVLLTCSGCPHIQTGRVLIAWKDTREARRAVSDAMPFLVMSREVIVATVEEDDLLSARESADDVVRFLARHGVSARSDIIAKGKNDQAFELIEMASEAEANLIVSGGYGHSRLREWAFGGVTKSLLGTRSINRLFSY